jgi:LacI family transcriptional regulator
MSENTILVFRMSRYDSWHKKVQALSTAADKRGWHIQVIDQPSTGSSMRKLVEFWHPKGVVIAEAWRKKIYIPFRDVPTVFFDCDPAFVPKGRPNVLHATKPICEAVIRELLSIGCTSVAYIGWFRKEYWSEDRIRYLKEILGLHGMGLHLFDMRHADVNDPARLNARLCKWLKSLPLNCGIFAANDTIAEPLIAAANASGLSIPDDIAIVSMGNEQSVCERLSPSLTTFSPEYGILADRVMDILDGRHDLSPLDVLTLRLIRRQSTRRFKRHDAEVEAAVEHIRREACNGLKAHDVLSDFTCSRRMAELRFKDIVGRSMFESILDVRMERCLELLANQSIPIGAIADLCGFPSALVMRRQFRARTGTTPTAWREKSSRSARPLGGQ